MYPNLGESTAKTQSKFHQHLYRYRAHLSVPEHKFLVDMVFGILKSKHIHLAKCARALREEITPKKTEERLSYHLGKREIWERLHQSHIGALGNCLRGYRYLIYDGSDISKPYAEKMEGLSMVRDASNSAGRAEPPGGRRPVLAHGYHWDNLIGVSKDGQEMLPIYSEIYSVKLDRDYQVSENHKIIRVIQSIVPHSSSQQILVYDRGGDRRVLINEFLNMGLHFIIRQNGKRHLNYNGKNLALKRIYRKAKLTHTYRVTRNYHGREVEHLYQVGALRVYFPTADLEGRIEIPLWLVVVKEEGRGYSWFLCFLDTDKANDLRSRREAIEIAMKGYQYRWKVEEFHRQIKQDYSLENILYQRYEAVRAVGALLAIVMSFLSKLPKVLIRELILNARFFQTCITKDLPKYIYYRITEAVRIALSNASRYKYQPLPNDLQLVLKL